MPGRRRMGKRDSSTRAGRCKYGSCCATRIVAPVESARITCVTMRWIEGVAVGVARRIGAAAQEFRGGVVAIQVRDLLPAWQPDQLRQAEVAQAHVAVLQENGAGTEAEVLQQLAALDRVERGGGLAQVA